MSAISQTEILHHADVRVLDDRGARAEAIAWRDGTVLAVGSHADVARIAGADATSYDAKGATVLPGFVDAHHHPAILALYGGTLQLTPPLVTDIPSLQLALAEASRVMDAAGAAADEWLVVVGWDEANLKERRAPTRRELDDAVPNRPLFALHYSCHRGAANSPALTLAKIDQSTADPSGGAIGRAADGSPNGLLIERAMSPVEAMARASLRVRDGEGFLARIGAHHHAMAAVGITRVVDAAVPGDLLTLYQEALRRDLLVVPTITMPVATNGYLNAPWDVIEGPVTGEGGELLRMGPLKLIFDGAPACALCLRWYQMAGMALSTWALCLRRGSLDPLRASLSTAPRLGWKVRTGLHLYTPDESHDVIAAALARGFSVASHAIGNEAIERVLATYEAAGSALGRTAVPRLEHATFADRRIVARIRDLGLAVVVQPHFLSLPSFGSAPSVPGLPFSPARSLIDAGVLVAGSSDAPVAGFDPLDGIRSAVSRRTAGGHTLEAEQRITLDEAIAMYTRNGAKAAACFDECGSLEVGKRADLVLLDRALRSEADLAAVSTKATVIGGVVRHGALG